MTALICLKTEHELGAHYSPDLFHVQQDLSKATSAPLARKVTACENALKAAEQELNQIVQEQKDYAIQAIKPVGRPVDYPGRIHEASVKLATATLDLEEPGVRRTQVRESIKASLAKHATWLLMEKSDKCRYEEKALECAHIFQGSTSNVEGRNGCLSLHHSSFPQMNERKLEAATVVDNTLISDRTEQRRLSVFFEQPHADLFEWLVQVTDFPAQPRTWASKRGKKVDNG